MNELEFRRLQSEYVSKVYPPRFSWQTEHPYIISQEQAIFGSLDESLEGKDVLVIPCGEGADLPYILPHGPRSVIAADLSLPRIRHALGKFPEILTLAADVTALPFAPESFDLICTRDLFHHLTPSQKRQALGQLFHLLRPHGRLLIIEPNSRNWIVKAYSLIVREESGLRHNCPEDYLALARQLPGHPEISRRFIPISQITRLFYHYHFGLGRLGIRRGRKIATFLEDRVLSRMIPSRYWGYFEVEINKDASGKAEPRTSNNNRRFSRVREQAAFFDHLVQTRRKTQWCSCGYRDRYDPGQLRQDGGPQEFIHKLFARLLPTKAGCVLDLGAGTGYYLPELDTRAQRIVGIDVSLNMLRENRLFAQASQLNVRQCLAQAEQLPFKDQTFDVILAMDVLHHLQDPEQALGEIVRTLKINGCFVGLEPNVLNPVTFLMHLVPWEERRALQYNFPWKLHALLRRHFQSVELWEENTILTRSGRWGPLLTRVFNRLQASGVRKLSLRQAFSAQKPNLPVTP